MLTVAKEIMDSRQVVDKQGNKYPLHSETPLSQCEFIQSIINRIDASVCLEIGLAYGISSMFIGESICHKPNRKYFIVDPFQRDWANIGLHNLERCNFSDFVEYHEDFSHNVLPLLLSKGIRIDFAYVDTIKVFDVVLLDAYYVSRLLRVGGVMVFDDCKWPGVKRMVRYISQWPHLTVYERHVEYHSRTSKKLASQLANMLPYKEGIFSQELLKLDEDLGTNGNCVAFQKTREDDRNWDWFINF
jgi:predicted O-methyltransferase YrrM